MKRPLTSLSVLFIVLFLGGCLTRHESEYFPNLVGQTVTLLRPCYAYQYPLITGVWLNTSRDIWWLEERTAIDKILAETESEETRNVYRTRRPIPNGAKFTIQRIQENRDLGGGGHTYAIGQLQFDSESLECAVTIAGPSYLIRTPWEPMTLPEYPAYPK